MNNKKILIANWLLNPDNPQNLPLKEAEEEIKRRGLDKVYREIELPLIEVLEKMQNEGVAIDKGALKKMTADHDRQISLLEKKIYKAAGEKFNINSPQQLSAVLLKKLGTALSSTKAEKLQGLKGAHPIIDLILRYRGTFKIKSTYLEPFGKLGGRVHTTFIQTGAVTGRLSSQNPNMQNVPPIVRKIFVAGRGYKLVSLDYSQLDLRILAALSGDQKMMAAFARGDDIHKLTASQVFKVDLQKVEPKMRDLAKTLNFGVIYGMGAAAFSKTSGLSRKEAEQFIKEYFSDFPEIKKWQEKIKQKARKNGFVKNLNGRMRWLPLINSADRFLAAEAERAAINMPVQSLGADIIKLAMIKVFNEFKKNSGVRLLLSVHDELLFEIKSDKVRERVKKIKRIMEEIYLLNGVDLKVGITGGKSWGNLKTIV